MTGTCSTCNLWCGSGDDQHAKCRATTKLPVTMRDQTCMKWQHTHAKCRHCGAMAVRAVICGSCGAPQ